MLTPTSLDLMPKPFDWITIPNKGYDIAKYPVTNDQYRKFIEAGGYNTEKWWTKHGWKACRDGWHLVSGRMEASGEAWTEPRFWTNSHFNDSEQPVAGASWYEAVAFCLWLSDVTGENIILPTEEQWQYAAQGDDGRHYPWGNEWDDSRCCNSVDKGFLGGGSTSPVTLYEGKGDSFFGVVDMAGNVWEWCLTDYVKLTNDINSDAHIRVMRGGSWISPSTGYLFCGYRIRNASSDRQSLPGNGFRPVRFIG